MFFAQEHRPGELCQSDFTHCRELDVTINGQAFPHLIYHFVLTYSNWETGTICYSETFESLREGLQNALSQLGGVPLEHRTDRMSAAVNNLCDGKDRVEAAIRFLLGSQQALNAEEATRLTEENAPAPLKTVSIDPVSLSVFDELLTREEPAA